MGEFFAKDLDDVVRTRHLSIRKPARSASGPPPGRSLSILYTSLSSGRAEWRGVDPWGIVHRAEAWYLVGRCHKNEEPRVFRMDRIGSV